MVKLHLHRIWRSADPAGFIVGLPDGASFPQAARVVEEFAEKHGLETVNWGYLEPRIYALIPWSRIEEFRLMFWKRHSFEQKRSSYRPIEV